MGEPRPVQFDLTSVLQKNEFSTPAIVAATAVMAGAREVRSVYGSNDRDLGIRHKNDRSISTSADLRSARAGIEVVYEMLPHTRMVEEESGVIEGTEPVRYQAYFDPLDGTSGFARGQRYATIGMEFCEIGSLEPVAAAIVHPFESKLVVAERGRGTYDFPLDDTMSLVGEGTQRRASRRDTVEGSMVYLDALRNPRTASVKTAVEATLDMHAHGGDIHIRSTGSSLDHESKVATGSGDLVVVHAIGGFWDLAGRLPITEAGGLFLDGQTLEGVTGETLVAFGGSPKIVEQVAPHIQEIYSEYTGYR